MEHKFKVGDKVRCEGTNRCGECTWKQPSVIYCIDSDIHIQACGAREVKTWIANECLPLFRLVESVDQPEIKTQPQEVMMNDVIAGLYEKTADAVVVNKWFGAWLNEGNFATRCASRLLLTLNGSYFLNEAYRLEAEEKAKAEK